MNTCIPIILIQWLTFWHVCFICMYLHIQFGFLQNNFQVNHRHCDTSSQNKSACVFSEYLRNFLYTHMQYISHVRKLTIISLYNLLFSPCSNFPKYPKNVFIGGFYKSGSNQISSIAFSCYISSYLSPIFLFFMTF